MLKYTSKHRSKFKFPRGIHSRLSKTLSQLILFILILNFLLIAIVNPSLLNPGPNNLKICYQNVRGLIPFSELGKPQPSLDVAKIFELNAYTNQNRPDVVILNETWINKSIKDDDLIYTICTIFRNDRSQLSHQNLEKVYWLL